MDNIVIRKAKPEEAKDIIDISVKVWNTTYKDIIPKEIIDKLQSVDDARIKRTEDNIRNNNNTIVALVDGKIVGFNTYGKSRDSEYPSSGEIYAGYILDDYQGLGLGRKMALICMEELLKEGYTTMITKCLEGNPSNRFHKSLGGIMVGQSSYDPLGIHVGVENIYYHEDLKKTLEYNLERVKKYKR